MECYLVGNLRSVFNFSRPVYIFLCLARGSLNDLNSIMPYSKEVVQRFEAVLADPKKHSVGSLDRKNPKVATGLAGAPACGDVMQLQLLLDDNEKIVDVKFKTYGCGSAIASSSLFVDMMMGKTVEEAKLIKDRDIAEVLKLPAIKLHCSVLAEDAIRTALVDYETKQTADYKHPILDQQ
jgi:nitrogen fixation protein NifU and related proteins